MRPTPEAGITGVVLAGGASRRFPEKAFIRLDGPTIIERNVVLLKDIFENVLVSTNMPEAFFRFGAPMVGDILSSLGPMSGIYSSLIASGAEAVFVLACDMPFVKGEVISLIVEKHVRASALGPVDATIPVFHEKAQPLLGIYGRTALSLLEHGIMNEKTSMALFMDEIRTNFVAEADIRAVDPEGRSFVNINTMDDYEKFIVKP